MTFLNTASPEMLFLLLFLAAVIAILAYAYFFTNHKSEELRKERDQLRKDDFQKEIEIAEVAARLQEANAATAKQEQTVQRLSTELGKLQQQREAAEQQGAGLQSRCDALTEQRDQAQQHLGDLRQAHDDLTGQHDGLREQLQQCQAERDALAQRIEHLDSIDANVWLGQTHNGLAPPAFVPRQERTTRLVTFLNLKGGVGKTTLVANLAAAYATGVAGKPLRVLAVDLDYQGTLSNMCVMRELLDDRRNLKNRRTAHLLLDDDVTGRTLESLIVPIDGTAGKGKVIVADDELDHVDFRQQARFAVDQHEVRFRYRTAFHSPTAWSDFDLVFFDCPPRLTASSINALAASDWIVIPTSLHPNDVYAVPRTLYWLDKLRDLSGQCGLAGIILNRTYRQGTVSDLTANEVPLLEQLHGLIAQKHRLASDVLTNVVGNSPEIYKHAAGSTPFGATAEGREFFQDVAKELYQRIKG